MRGSGLRLLLIALAAAGGVAMPPSGTARACSCVDATELDMLAEAAVVVGGGVRGERREFVDGEDYIVWEFQVDERFRGDTPDVIELEAYAA